MRLAYRLAVICSIAGASAADAAVHATFLQPVDGLQLTAPPSFRWTAVAGATAYQLWVGTTPGGADLFNSGETGALSLPAVAVPEGVTVFARVWTLAGSWRYADVRFAVSSSPPSLRYDGTSSQLQVDLEVGRDLTTVTGASPATRPLLTDLSGDGLADVFLYDPVTGAWHQRINRGDGTFDSASGSWWSGYSAVAADIDGDRRADVFLYNRVSGAWQLCFSNLPDPFTCMSGVWAPNWSVFPADFNGDGRSDLFLHNAAAPPEPNSGRWFKVISTGRGPFAYVDGQPRWAHFWRISPGEFNGDGRADLFLYQRETGRWFVCLDAGAGFTYLEGAFDPDADVYTGDFDGDARTDLFLYQPASGHWRQALARAPGTFQSSVGIWGRGWTVTVASFDGDARADLLLYDVASGRWARVLARGPGAFDYSYGFWDAGFTTVLAPATTPISRPMAVITSAPGGVVDASKPFTWTTPPLARAYRLQVGTAAGASNLHDSGRVSVTRRFVRGLPQGPRLYGRLGTETGGVWRTFDFTFVVRTGTTLPTEDEQIEVALRTTSDTRQMASAINAPFGWTALYAYTTGVKNAWGADCADYAVILRSLLGEAGVTLSYRIFHVGFNFNAYDVHTLVELLDPRLNRWLLLDPTFAMTVRRSADGRFATAREVSDAARAQRWSDLQFEALGPDGLSHAENYYIDYPLLFLNVFQGSGATTQAVSVLPYLEPLELPAGDGSLALFVLQSEVSPRAVVIDGGSQLMTSSGADHLTHIFLARSIGAPAGGSPPLAAYRPRRYVF